MNTILIYQYACFFIIYAFLGWCTEVIYAVLTTGKFVNRGFLNGPVCPIYGFGVVSIVSMLLPISNNLPLLFLSSVILTSLLEFVTGFILEKMFQSKWWDYTDKPFNIMGYVCLSFSIMWGFGAIFIVNFLHPTIYMIIKYTPMWLGLLLIAICYIAILIDSIVTIKSVIGLNARLSQLEKITERINDLSIEIGENLSKSTLAFMEKNEIMKLKWEDKKDEVELLLNTQKELLFNMKFTQKRLVKAFPSLKHNRFSPSLKKIRDFITRK